MALHDHDLRNNPNLPVTLEEDLLQSMQENRRAIAERVGPAIIGATEQTQDVNRNLLDTTKRLSSERNVVIDEVRAAQDRLVGIASNPKVVNRILGIFDSDFKEEVQIRKLQRGKFELGEITGRMAVAESTRNVQIQTIQSNLRGITAFYDFNQQGILNETSDILNAFQIRSGVRRDQVQAIEGTTDKVLNRWQANPDLMPPNLRGLNRLVTAELFNRKVKNANLRAIDISNTRAQESLFETQREDFLNEFDTMQDLASAQKQFRQSPEQFPKFVRANDFNSEISRRTDIELDLRSSKQALAAGDLQLAELRKTAAFSKATLVELDTIAKNFNGKGETELFGVPVTAAEIATARATKQDTLVERQQTNALLISAITKSDELRSGAVEGAVSIGQMGNPYGDPLQGMPTKVRTAVQAAQSLSNVLGPSIKAGDIGAAVVMSREWTAANEIINEEIEKIVDNTTKNSKEATREYLTNRGRISSPAAAAGLLIENAPNQFAVDADPFLKNGYRAFSTELIKTGFTGFTGDDDESLLGAVFAKLNASDKENAALINDAIIASKVRTLVGDSGFQILLQDSLIRLTATTEKDPMTPAEQGNPYTSLIDENGDLADSLFNLGEGRSKLFSYDAFYLALSQAQQQAVIDGTISPGKNLANNIIDLMRGNATALNERFTASPIAASLKTAVFPNGVQELIFKRLGDMAETMPSILANAAANKAALTDVISRTIAQDPNLGP